MFELRRALVGALLALCAGTVLASHGIAPPSFDDETTLTHQDATHIAMVTWWSKSDLKDILPDDTDPAEMAKFVAALQGYAIFGLVDVKLTSTDISASDAARAALRSSARLTLGDRPARSPVREADLPERVRHELELIRPTMSNVLGKFGGAIEFVVFKDGDANGVSLADPAGNVDVVLAFDQESFSWHLPLVSTLPLRIDRATGDTFPGDYEFSPFTGHKLETK